MRVALSRALHFMSSQERRKYFFLLLLRAGIAVFDLIGILAIGFLATSIALFLTQGSDANRSVRLAGLELPAITAQSLPWISVLILLLFLSKAIISILLTRKLAIFLARIEARAARIIVEKAFGTNLNESRKHSREEIVFAVQYASTTAFNGMLNHLGMIVAEGFLFLLVILAFFIVNPLAALGAIFYFGLIGLIIQFFVGRLMYKTGIEITQASVAANTAVGDLYNTIKESTVLSRNSFYYNKVYQARIKAASNFANQFILSGMPRYIIETSLIISIALFVLIQAASGDIVSAAGTVGVFLTGGLRLTASLLPLQNALLQISKDIPVSLRAFELLEIQDESVTATNSDLAVDNLTSFNGIEIKFNEVSFKYPSSEQQNVERVSFSVVPGQQVALIGPSGAGKSTIADLIIGLLQPSLGVITLNDESPKRFVANNPGVVSYVPQKPGLVSGSILDNIALGIESGNIDDLRVQEVIRQAHLSNVVDALPHGVNSDLGKHLDELSGGQLQRIGLARALYSKPKLLILDEATSALDANSESEINAVLQEMRGSVTVVIIAHRFKLLQNSDQIFLIEEGKISDSGTYAQLLATNRVFQELASLDNQP